MYLHMHDIALCIPQHACSQAWGMMLGSQVYARIERHADKGELAVAMPLSYWHVQARAQECINPWRTIMPSDKTAVKVVPDAPVGDGMVLKSDISKVQHTMSG
jgi:hypothetical protein